MREVSMKVLATLIKKLVLLFNNLVKWVSLLMKNSIKKRSGISIRDNGMPILNKKNLPNTLRNAYWEGLKEEKNGNYEEAKRIYNNILEFDPNQPLANWGLASIHLKENDYKNAEIQISKLIELGFHNNSNYDLLRQLREINKGE